MTFYTRASGSEMKGNVIPRFDTNNDRPTDRPPPNERTKNNRLIDWFNFEWLKALANKDTLLRTHCCRHKYFPVCPCAQHLLRTQILCPGHKKCFWFCSETFCVRNKCFPGCTRKETSWATMFPQQYVLLCHRLSVLSAFSVHLHKLAQTAVILKLFSVSAESLTYNF